MPQPQDVASRGGNCSTCGTLVERDVPSGVASDGRLRNMVDPGSGQDMGGNPLQEGILGDWQNRSVRDESFASVQVNSRMSDTFDMTPTLPWAHMAATTTAQIEPQHGIHNGVVALLGFLDASINGLNARTQGRDIVFTYSPFNREGFEQVALEPVTVDVAYDEYLPAVRDIVENGRQMPNAVGDVFKELIKGMQAEQIPFPPGISPSQVKIANFERDAALPAVLAPIALAAGRALLPVAAQAGKKLLPKALNAAKGAMTKANAGKALNFGSKALAMNQVGGALGGLLGGGAQQQAQVPQQQNIRGLQELSYVTADHPSSVPFIGTGGPEDVDQREFNADASITDLNDPTVDGTGGTDSFDSLETTGDEYADKVIDALPELLEYYESEEPGIQNPKIRHLWELFQAEEQKAAKVSMNPSLPPNATVPQTQPRQVSNPPIPNAGLQGEAPGQGRCPNCGGVLGPNGQCPQCGAAGIGSPGHDQSNLHQPGLNPAGIGQMQQTGIQASKLAINDHQGPRNNEQFAAVAELLEEQGRHEEVVTMLRSPWDYADELSLVQQKPNKPPIDESAPEAAPVQEEAPPGDTIPVPVPQAPGQIAAALNRVGADAIAPRCPKCESATTGLLNENGDCRCHRCDNQWKVDGVKDKLSRVATPKDTVPEHKDLHIHKDVPIDLPAADQDSPDRDEHDTSRTWSTPDGDPLRVGDTYEMKSAQFSIPDIVKIEAIKPDGIDLTIVGEYSARGGEEGEELSFRHEIPREEAEVYKYEFTPVDYNDREPEFDDENPGEPVAAPGEVTDLSRPHSSSVDNLVNMLRQSNVEPEFAVRIIQSVYPGYDPSDYTHSDDYWKAPKDRNQHFEQRIDEQPDRPWERGDWGRGIVTSEGEVHLWPEDLGTHEEYVTRKGLEPRSFFTVSPEGDVKPYSYAGLKELDTKEMEIITQSHPELKEPELSEGGGEIFNFASTEPSDPEEYHDPDLEWLREGSSFEIPEGVPASEPGQRTAGAKFSPSEQRGFIDEDGVARNSDKLQLGGTHYETRFDAKANPDRVPDDHLGLGLL